jgi:hypothetical protein
MMACSAATRLSSMPLGSYVQPTSSRAFVDAGIRDGLELPSSPLAMSLERQLVSPRLALLPYLLVSVLALVMGVLTMRVFDVPAALWGRTLPRGRWARFCA